MRSRSIRWWWVARALVLCALVVHLEELYKPGSPGVPPFPQADKVAHIILFSVPVFVALLAGMPPRWVLAVALVHAPVSEVIQANWVPMRSGDPWDVVADVVGVGLGWLAARWAMGRPVKRRLLL